MYLFMQQYLLSAYYVPGIVLGNKIGTVKKNRQSSAFFPSVEKETLL